MTAATAPSIPIRSEDQAVWQQRLIAGQEARLDVQPRGQSCSTRYCRHDFAVQSERDRQRVYMVAVRTLDGAAIEGQCSCTGALLGARPCKHLALCVDHLSAWPFPLASLQELPLPEDNDPSEITDDELDAATAREFIQRLYDEAQTCEARSDLHAATKLREIADGWAAEVERQ